MKDQLGLTRLLATLEALGARRGRKPAGEYVIGAMNAYLSEVGLA